MNKKLDEKLDGNLPPELAAPARRALAAAGIQQLEDLAKFSVEEVRQWHGIGPNAISVLSNALSDRGLFFANKK